MTPTKKDPPTRTFTVLPTDPNKMEAEVCQANTMRLHENGGLDLLVSVGGSLWTAAVFAPGCWGSVRVSLPTEADLVEFKRIADEDEREMQARLTQTIQQQTMQPLDKTSKTH